MKLIRNSHTHLTRTPAFARYIAAALERTTEFALVLTNNGFIVHCSIVLAKANAEVTRYLYLIKEDSL